MKKKHFISYGLNAPITKKTILIMKLTFLLITLNLASSFASVYSQKVSLNLKDVKLSEAISEITKQTNLDFAYSANFVDIGRTVSISVNNTDLKTVLDKLLDGTQLLHLVLNGKIFIGPKELYNVIETNFLQQQKLSGTITDATTGEPVIGVNVVIEGTTIGVVSDANGKFTIEIAKSDGVLVVSFLGYNSERIIVNGQSNLEIKLVPDITKLDEVVVVGYGTQKRTTLSGSVSTLKGSEIASAPVANVTNSLAGHIPGLIVYSNSSEPGNDKANLLIRGQNTINIDNDINSNAPLIVVDGIANRGFEHIDPNDIESISVLKDASAAIYGAQAANGVILITTKRGKLGKPTITLTLNQGYNAPTRLPELADAYTYSSMVNEIYPGTYSADDVSKFKDGSDPLAHPNTNWYKATMKPWSVQRSSNLSINGGSENLKYLVSFGARYNDGVYKSSASNYTQYNFRTNIDGKVNKYIAIAFDVAGRQENIDNPNSDIYTIFRSIVRGKPTMTATWPNGQPGPATEGGAQSVIITTNKPGYNNKTNYILESNLKLNIFVPWVKGLSLSTNISFDKNFVAQKSWGIPYSLYNWNGTTKDAQDMPVLTSAKYGPVLPSLGQSYTDGKNITLNALLNYEIQIANKHNVKILVGSEKHTFDEIYLGANRGNFLSPALDQMFAGAKDVLMTNDGNAKYDARLNYFGRVNYNFNQKYLAEFVWRYDGSIKFDQSSRYGFFPGISLGYRISEEGFFKDNVSFINNLKIRGSWGKTGNDRIKDYQYLSTYAFNDYLAVFGATPLGSKALYENVIPNINVTWEVANQRNIGLEGSLLNDKLAFEVDYFNNNRNQILIQRNASIPGLAGLSLPPENLGKVTNAGFDGSITYRDMAGDFKYSVSLNVTRNKNKIVFWDETPGIDKWQQTTGHPIGGELYYQADGIFHTQDEADKFNAKFTGGVIPGDGVVPGDVRFKDVNTDGVIDAKDRVRDFRSAIPTLTGGLIINLGYKNLDLSILFQGASGAITYIENTEAGNLGNYLKEYADNRWTPNNTNTDYPRTWDRTNMYWTANKNTFWLKSTDYIRLKSIELGYNTGERVNKLLGIQGLRIFVNGFNLFTMDKLGIYDPEGAAANGQFYIYPMNKTVNAGVTLTF